MVKEGTFQNTEFMLVNAFILYNEWCAIQGKPKLKQFKFRTNVINQIVEFVGPDGVRPVQRAVAHTRLSERHFLLIFHRIILRGELHWFVLFVDQLRENLRIRMVLKRKKTRL